MKEKEKVIVTNHLRKLALIDKIELKKILESMIDKEIEEKREKYKEIQENLV